MNKYIYAIDGGINIILDSVVATSIEEAQIKIMDDYGYPADTEWEEFLHHEELYASELYDIEEF